MTQTTSNAPVIGEAVNWSTTLGSVGFTSVTNSMGIAQTVLTPLEGQTGTATVTGSVGNGDVEDQATVFFVAMSISQVDLSVSDADILADGVSTTTFFANALDDTNNPAAFVSIQFSTDMSKYTTQYYTIIK